MRQHFAAAAMLTALAASPTYAQTPATEVQRDSNQQQRIEQGLQSGQLSTGEAARLERGESRIDTMQQKALSNGTLSPAEAARIQGAQNRESEQIKDSKSNATTGNPASASSQRMQADVQRDVNQQNRTEQGVQSGALTNRETSKVEGGQAKTARAEARAGANGHIGANEQRRVQRAENRNSTQIARAKSNAHTQ